MTNTFPPTPEQVSIIQAALTHQDVAVEALAGTGKTTTLQAVSMAMPQRRGLYLAYNTATAEEARGRFPANIESRTLHSVAFRAVGFKYKHRLDSPRMKPWDVATQLGAAPMAISRAKKLLPWQVAQLASQTVKFFCYSADDEPQAYHVPKIPGAEGFRQQIVEQILPLARRLWEDILDENGTLPFTHDYYLKIFCLGKPKLDYDFLMLDEAQDSNDVVLDLLQRQESAQRLLVGDRYQILYAWRGSRDQLSRFQAPHRLAITQSFRFGPAVAAEGQKWLSFLESPLELRGYDQVPSELAPCPNALAVLCRTNAGVVEEAINALEVGLRPAVVGGMGEVRKFAEAAGDMMQGKKTNHADLVAFDSWEEVQEYAQTPDGSDLAVSVRLVDNHGPERIIEIANSTVPEAAADLTVSTAHKSKGRQWSTVRIAGDFFEPDFSDPDGVTYSAAEARLAYVAVTRAQHVLDRGGLHFIDKLLRMTAANTAVLTA